MAIPTGSYVRLNQDLGSRRGRNDHELKLVVPTSRWDPRRASLFVRGPVEWNQLSVSQLAVDNVSRFRQLILADGVT